ncbi:hypothetical protein H0H87_010509 [Tephrocybe sp. NHM501043]|nr:hypothetical protein H0H87_010509 [Tephrocybe sp. NHM501043]
MPQTSSFSLLDQPKDSIGLKNNPCATQKNDVILPPLDLYRLETLVTAINDPMDKDVSSSNISVTKKSNLVLRSPLFGPSSLKNDTHAIQAVFGSASLKNNPSATQKEDAIFPLLNLDDGCENLVTATNDPMDKDASSLNMMVTKKSNLVLRSALFGPASLKNDTHEICREGATCPPLTLDGLENPVTTADAPMDKDPSSLNMTVSKMSKESPLFDPVPPAIKEMVSAWNNVKNEVVTTIIKMDKKQEHEDDRKQSNKIVRLMTLSAHLQLTCELVTPQTHLHHTRSTNCRTRTYGQLCQDKAG